VWLQEEKVVQLRMALHNAEQELVTMTSIVDTVIHLHPSTVRKCLHDDLGSRWALPS
jgi:hypothetical protein